MIDPADTGPVQSTPEAVFRLLVRQCLADYRAASERIMASDDPDGPHQARVALRRLRAILAAFDPILDKAAAATLQDRVRTVFKIIGKLRDADVRVDHARPEMRQDASAAADRVRAGTRKALGKPQAAEFVHDLRKTLRGKRWLRRSAAAKDLSRGPMTEIAVPALERSWRHIAEQHRKMAGNGDAARHEYRKRLKKLRYQVDCFGSYWPGSRRDDCLKRLEALQDHLGELNDMLLAGALDAETAAADGREARRDRLLRLVETLSHELFAAGPFWR